MAASDLQAAARSAAEACAMAGSNAYWKCASCGKLFAEEDGRALIRKLAASRFAGRFLIAGP